MGHILKVGNALAESITRPPRNAIGETVLLAIGQTIRVLEGGGIPRCVQRTKPALIEAIWAALSAGNTT